MNTRITVQILSVMAILATLICLVWTFASPQGAFVALISKPTLLVISLVSKLFSLLLATLWGMGVVRGFEAGNPARKAWLMLTLGMAAMLLGQLWLAPFQVLTGKSPFPSYGDLFFVLSYPSFLLAFYFFFKAYRESGLPLGSPAEWMSILGVVAILAVVLALQVLKPILAAPGSRLETFLNAFYPLGDLLLLLPVALLFRINSRMRGGEIGRVWMLLLVGFLVLTSADVFFAFYSSLGHANLDSLLHAAFVMAYFLMALGLQRQARLLAD